MNEATPQSRRAPATGGFSPQPPRPAAGAGPAAREISIPGLAQALWRGLWLVLAAIVLAVLITGIALKLRSPLYEATMIVAPAPTDLSAASQLARELEQFANLATLAQSPAKLERISDLERYLQMFRSTALAARLQAEHGLLQTVFEDSWDAERQVWHPPPGTLASIKAAMLGFFGFPAWTEPDVAQLAEWLSGRIQVTRIGGSSMLRLSMEHPQPRFAVAVVEMAHRTADELLREDALARIDSQIAQVESALETATAPTRRRALEEMLVAQYQAQALLGADQPYAAQVIVPAAASATPISANPLLILALAAVVGAIVGIFVVFLRDALR